MDWLAGLGSFDNLSIPGVNDDVPYWSIKK
jgi:hypothetical protein